MRARRPKSIIGGKFLLKTGEKYINAPSHHRMPPSFCQRPPEMIGWEREMQNEKWK
jgi:hypothetical protein